METQKRTREIFQSKLRQTASKTRANNLRLSCKYRVKKLFFLVCVIFGQKRGKLNARRNNYSEHKSYIEFSSQFARVYAKFFSTIFILPTEGLFVTREMYSLAGSFENKALENEDQSTKHPKHPNLDDEVPKTRKRSTQNSKPVCPLKSRDSPLSSDQC